MRLSLLFGLCCGIAAAQSFQGSLRGRVVDPGGQVIERQQIEDLPNLGRNPFLLSRLTETVVFNGNPKFTRMQDQSGSSAISIAGGPSGANNYTLDGISITDSTNRAVIIPSQEA